MKKLLIGLLAVGLVIAFVGPSYAADVSLSGTFRVRGFALSKDHDTGLKSSTMATSQYYDQRFRSAFTIAPEEGVAVKGRFDLNENTWGTASTSTLDTDFLWGEFTTGLGLFKLGHQIDGTWGTDFGNEETELDKATWTGVFGPVSAGFQVCKSNEIDRASASADADVDAYKALAVYKWEGGEVGGILVYGRGAEGSVAENYKAETQLFIPYMKANFGPLYVEAELNQYFGKSKKYNDGTPDVDKEGLSYYAMAKMNLGPVYVGGLYAYVQGEDADATKVTLGKTGSDWNPGLVLWNDGGNARMAGNEFGLDANNATTGVGGQIFGLFAGASPIEKLTLKASLYASYADEKQGYLNDDFGTEFDLEATYKIFDSVSYYIGFGYLWTGDYFKGTNAAAEVENIYFIRHQIQWSF